jgi:hypothetical protein
LSRWDLQPDGTAVYFDSAHSQDAWIFQPPIREFKCDWPLGIPGCDNRLTWEAARAGIEVLNPSRSIRAHHLHLSGVRNYTERQRLPGPVLPVPGTHLGTPWLWFVLAGRADDRLEVTVRSLVGQPRSELVFVDPGGMSERVRSLYPDATVVPLESSSSAMKRRGAAAADSDAILCFLETGIEAAPGLASAMLSQWTPDSFLSPDCDAFDSVLACSKALFDRIGGIDELIGGESDDIADLREVFSALGYAERHFAAALLSGSSQSPSSDERTRSVNRGYSRAKAAVMRETRRPISLSARREIHRAVERRWFAERGLVPEAPCAAIAYREQMGYSVERLEPGASSHNNDARPFLSIPQQLLGKPFTQVVASRVSPVEVEFRTTGKLYVLVGTDWHGYYPATQFLRDHGYREPVAEVATRRGTGFEVWSMLGEAGESYVLPTQVMLVAEELATP